MWFPELSWLCGDLQDLPTAVMAVLMAARRRIQWRSPLEIQWVTSPTPDPETVYANLNPQYLSDVCEIERPRGDHPVVVPRQWRKDSGKPNCFSASCTPHCESVLLNYIWENGLDVWAHFGCSRPMCYECLMLIRSYNELVAGQSDATPFKVGRCSFRMSSPWTPAIKNKEILELLKKNLRKDYKIICDFVQLGY